MRLQPEMNLAIRTQFEIAVLRGREGWDEDEDRWVRGLQDVGISVR